MRFERQKPGIFLAVVIAVLALLPAVAVLQYRWIGEVSRAERERMQGSLRTATLRFSQDFNGEIARIYFTLQDRRPGMASGSLDELAQRCATWTASAQERNLVRNFYAIEGEKLLLLDRAMGRFEPAAWPPELASVRARMEARAQGIRPLPGGPPDADNALLVAPRFRRGAAPFSSPPGGGRRPELVGFAVAELDREFIEKQFVPELVQRYFAAAGELEYQVLILNRAAPDRVIYRSDPGLTAAGFSSPEATAYLFEMRPDMRGGPGRLQLRAGLPRFRPDGLPPGGGGWEVRVRYRLGSVEEAVGQARRRNLAISFVVLLLMGASIAVLVATTRRAQRLARTQMEFVAGVSHELRTPLTVICSAGDNLADGLIASEQQVRRYGLVIRNEGRRLSQMVEQILGFAGIQSGRVNFKYQPVEVSSVVERAIAACAPDLAESHCPLEKRIDPDLPPVMADPTSLVHCLRNLLSNALKYGNHEPVGLRAALAPNGNGSEVRISVTDQGPGIDPADLPHIFEPFYRGRKALAGQIHGAGLGLSLVKHIIESHGGKVDVTSSPGQGSCFTLRIPVPAQVTGAE